MILHETADHFETAQLENFSELATAHYAVHLAHGSAAPLIGRDPDLPPQPTDRPTISEVMAQVWDWKAGVSEPHTFNADETGVIVGALHAVATAGPEAQVDPVHSMNASVMLGATALRPRRALAKPVDQPVASVHRLY